MSQKENVTTARSEALPGLRLASLGVLVFSFTLPATKLALGGLAPAFIADGRAVVAGVAAAVLLVVRRAPLPRGREWLRLAVVVCGVVVGFPTLTSVALQTSSSAHGAVVVAFLPAATAVAGAIRARERPSAAFWLAAAAGATVVAGYSAARAGGRLTSGDLLFGAAVIVCAMGYAEGAVLARTLGGPRTICWALIIALPVTLPVALASVPARVPGVDAGVGFLYVSFGSMFLGFFAWYAGLARAGVARASQLQLTQTPLTLVWSALVLGERIDAWTGAVAVAVLFSVGAAQRARIGVGRGARARQASIAGRITSDRAPG